MVNLSSVILVSAIGVGLFFSKDIIAFLNSLKGFGQLPEAFGELPEEGIIPAIPNVLFGEGTTKQIVETVGGVQKTIFDLGVETRKQVDIGLAETQKTLEQAGAGIFEAGVATREAIFKAGVETQVAVSQIGESISQAGVVTREAVEGFGTGIFEAGVATREAVDVFFAPLFSLFGGQTQPKMILTQEQITDPTRGQLRFG